MTFPNIPGSSKTDKVVSLLKAVISDKEELARVLAWWNKNCEEIADFVKASDDSKTVEFIVARYFADEGDTERKRALGIAEKAIEALQKTVSEAKRARHPNVIRKVLMQALYADHEKQQKNLSRGRRLGVEARQKDAETKRARLEVAIQQLFDDPKKPGWGWTNAEIVRFLAPKFAGTYTSGTVAQAVKRVAATFRKARKLQQASKLPKR